MSWSAKIAPLAPERLQHLAVRPRRLLGERMPYPVRPWFRGQHHIVIQRGKRPKGRESPRGTNSNFFERIDLHVLHRLDDDRAVAINEDNFFVSYSASDFNSLSFSSFNPWLCADTPRTP